MKKFFLFVILFFITSKVHAYEIGVWTDEVIGDDNVIVKDIEVRYKWYKNITNFSLNYYIKNENDSLYPNIYLDDYIETDFTEWSEIEPIYKEERIIEYKIANRYRTLKPIRYIFFDNAIGGFINFRIAELNILIDNQPATFEIECSDCNSTYKTDMKDGLYDDVAYINNGGSLRIDLGAYYGIEQIQIELYMYDPVPNTKKIDLYFNAGDTLFDNIYAHKKIEIFTVSKDPLNPEKHLIIPDESFIENPVYSDWIYIDGYVNSTYYREMQTVPMYRYKDKKYRYYNIEKSYLDGYYTQVEDNDYIRDDDKYKTYYLYDYYVPDDNVKDPNKEINVISNSAVNNENKSVSNKKIGIVTKESNEFKKIKDNPTNVIEKNNKIEEDLSNAKEQNIKNNINSEKTDQYEMIFQMSLIISLITLFISMYLVKMTSQILSYQK